jgi:hypothetical protein
MILLVFISLFVPSVEARSQVTKPEGVKIQSTISAHTKWKEKKKKAVVYLPNKTTAEVTMKQARFTVQVGDVREDHYTICAFKLGDTNRVWIGVTQDFYLATDSGVVGGRLSDAVDGTLFWSESLTLPGLTGRESFEEIIKHFESVVDVNLLEDAFRGYRKPETDRQTTDLKYLRPHFFIPPLGFGGQMGYTILLDHLEFDRDHIQLTMRNKTMKRSGEIWIEIKSRKVIKAMENDEQTFPPSMSVQE